MGSISRHVHLQSAFAWKRLSEVAPDLQITMAPEGNGNGGPSEPMALVMIDPDGETHVYPFSEVARKKLIAELSGGIVIAPGGSI